MTDQEKNRQLHNAWWAALIAVFGGFWRRWFGGGFIDCPRFIKYIVGIAVVLGMYYLKGILDYYDWHMWAACITFMYHWAMSHGDYFWVTSHHVHEARVKWIDWILQKIYGKGNYYNFKGNVTGLFIRYTFTATLVAIAINNCWAITMGPVVTFWYALMGKLFPQLNYTKITEVLSGASCYTILWFCL